MSLGGFRSPESLFLTNCRRRGRGSAGKDCRQNHQNKDKNVTQLLKQPVAVIGIGCRFPGGLRSLDALWKALSDGRDCLGTLPAERFDVARYRHDDPGAPGMTYAMRAGIAGDVRAFDATFWGFSEKEAESLDPQQRMALTMTWEAFEDAGIPPSQLAGSDTAVYMGSASADMGMLHADDLASTNAYTMTGTQLSIISNRISYAFDFHGASMTVDTACSSALVALDMACRAVADGKVPAAVAGGVNVLLAPMGFVGFSKAHMLSKTGACRVFDEKADGYVRSEGGAVVLLKTLAQAQKDGDAVHAVIRATAVNSDGRTAGIALPNGKAQAALMAGIYGEELPKARVAYVEAHGTGTKAGDPIEARAIGEVLGHKTGAALAVGSVKANLGHLETASGMAGLAKVLCVLEKGEIPGNIHLETPNSAIDFAGLGLRVPVKTEKLPTVAGAPLVGLNSFGFGGTNAHVVLEQYRAPEAQVKVSTDRLLPLLVTAKSRESLTGAAKQLAERLARADVAAFNRTAAALFHQREHLPHRFYLKARTIEDALASLRTLAAGAADFKNAALGRNALGAVKSAWAYSGNGSQWVGMGRALFAANPVFAAAVKETDTYFGPLAGWNLASVLAADDAVWNLTDTSVAQPLLFAVQVGMTAVLRDEGLTADAYFGHSAGEVAAAWAAGALSLKDAVTVIYHRSRLQQTLAGTGAMAAVRLAKTPWDALRATHPEVTVAAVNADGDYTVSGTPEAVADFTAAVKTAGGKALVLPLTIAFHSAALEGLKADFLHSVEGICPTPSETFISSVTGKSEALLDAAYWWRNLRKTVQFKDAVTTAVDAGVTRFAEVGPHAVLAGYVKATLKAKHRDGTVTGLLRRGDGTDAWEKNHLQLAADGWSVMGLWPVVPRDRTLPHYVWNEKRCWPEPSSESVALFAPQTVNPLLGWKTTGALNTWVNELDPVRIPWLAGHGVESGIWYPAAGFMETAAAAARAVTPAEKALEIRHFNILKPLIFTEGAFHRVRTHVSDAGEITLESRPAMTDAWLTHVVARTVPTDWVPVKRTFDEKTLGSAVATDDFYVGLSRMGLNYTGVFKSVEHLWVKENVITARLSLPVAFGQAAMLVAPPLIDGALQTVFAGLAGKGTADSAWLPVAVDRLVLDRGGVAAWSEVTIRRGTVRSVTADVSLFDASGREILAMTGVRLQKTVKRPVAVPPAFYREMTRREWEPRSAEAVQKALTQALKAASAAFDGTLMPWADAEPLVRVTLAAFAYEAVQRRNESVPAELLFTTESFVVNEGWAVFLAECLVAAGWAEKRDAGYTVPTQTVPAAALLLRTLLARYPAEWPLWQTVNDIGRKIPELLTGDTDPETATNAAGRLCPSVQSELTALTLTHFVADTAREYPDAALNVGLVTTDAAGVKALRSACGANVHLTVVTPDARGKERLATALEKIEGVAVVTAEKAGTFDVVIVPGGLVRDVTPASALASLTGMVKPAGWLLVADTAPNDLTNFLEGIEADWWVEADGTYYPPMPDVAGWLSAVKQSGLEDARVLTPEATAPTFFFAARRPAFVVERERVAAVTAEGTDAALTATFKERLSAAGITVTEGAARRITVMDARTPQAITAVLNEAKALAVKGEPLDWWVVLNTDAAPAAAGVRALLRVVKNECPALSVHVVTLADTTAATLARVTEMLSAAKSEADEVTVIAGRLAKSRVERVGALTHEKELPAVLTFEAPGQLERLCWQRTEQKPLASDEIRVAVKATGLNFRDVMWAMGMLPEEALENGFSGPAMGMEAAGVVTEVGSAVTRFVPGDAVTAFAPACFATEIVTKAGAAVAKPANLPWAEAASVPVAFFTAWYALVQLARARKGERVLIHGAAGGVGLAAIQIAAMLGLEVYATAGTDAKRDLVRSLGVTHVYDSRRLQFADDVRRDTAGKGVNIVLNSLAGAAADASLSLLAPFGRFLELGKRDFYADRPMFLKPFAKNLAYFGIDVDQLLTADPALAESLLNDVMSAFADGKLRPLPVTLYPALRVKDAFRAMQASVHVGKIVVTTDDLTPVAERETPMTLSVDPEGLYLITGGLGGLGRAVAEKLVTAGARHLMLLSRHGAASDSAKAFVAKLEEEGVTVVTLALDIASSEAETEIQKVLTNLPPVKGVVHAAGFIRDALLKDQTEESLTSLWRVKVDGAALLDRASRVNAWPLDFFTVFSSATVLIGNPGQANYVAANAGLEAVVKSRRAAGLPANLIGWGPVADAGMLAEASAVKAQLERMLGAPSLTVKAVADVWATVTATGVDAVHYLAADWKRLKNLPVVAGPRFDVLTEGAGEVAASGMGLSERLKGKTDEEAVELLTSDVAREVARIMGLAPEELNVNQPVSDIGMDSLTVVELAMKLEERFGVRVAAGTAFAGATIRTMAETFYASVKAETPGNASADGEALIETMSRQHGVTLTENEKATLAAAADKKEGL